MAISDIQKGKGLCIIDPHGDMAETILNYILQERIDDVIYFNSKDVAYSIAFNPLKADQPITTLLHQDLLQPSKRYGLIPGDRDWNTE